MKRLLLILLVFTVACSDKQEPVKDDTNRPFEAIGIVPNADTLQPARVTLLDTCKPPRVVAVASKPPISKEADFYTHMTTYTAEQGLYSGISCIKKDHSGNLWFGTPGGGVSRYDGKTFTSYTTAQGLANNTVLSIAEDHSGNLWFGTAGGVSRYDGKSFTSYTTAQGLADNMVYSIAEDHSGNLWFGTYGGVSHYDPETSLGTGGYFTNYTTAQGLANNYVFSIAEDHSGNLWFGTAGGGVSRYDPSADLGTGSQSFTSYTTAQGLANNTVLSMAEDHSGNLWFGTYGGGVSRYDGKFFTSYTTAQGLANNTVFSIAEDHSGNLWFGTDGGVSRYDPETLLRTGGSFTNYTTAQGLTDNNVMSIAEDHSGNLWFGTAGGGVSRYDGKSFTSYTTAQGLADNTVYSIAKDYNGNLWFGTYGGGVSRYDPESESRTGSKSFTSYTTAQGLADNIVYSIVEDHSGNLWFGTAGGGVSRYDGKSFTSYTTAQGLANITVLSMAEDHSGNLWFGTYGGGVSRYDPETLLGTGGSFTSYTTAQGLANNDVRGIAEDHSGNLWFGTDGGVSRYDPETSLGTGGAFTNYTTAQGLADNRVRSIAEDHSGNLWFGTAGGGVSRYDGKSFTSYTTTQGLADNTIYSIVVDSIGNLWFGTNEGFSVLKGFTSVEENKNEGASVDRQQKKRLEANLLADNNMLNVQLFEDYTPAFETYNFKNGYPVKDCNRDAMLIDSKGIIWAGTGDKLVRFDYSAIYKDTTPARVFINAIKIDGADISWNGLMSSKSASEADSMAIVNEEVGSFGHVLTAVRRDSMQQKFGSVRFDSIARFYPIPHGLVLPYKHNNITFDFAAIEVARPYLVNYQYILEGYDKDWNPVTDKTTASFGNIQEGSYSFKLKAQSPEGVWSEPTIYTFEVLPPWYRTWWMYTVYVLLFLLALRSFIKWRERSLRAEKERLEDIVMERTEELVQKNIIVQQEKQKSEDLLLNILPEEIAEELKEKGYSDAKMFDKVTVLFTDFVGFTKVSEQLTPQQLVKELDTCFKAFDGIMGKYHIEKIKTVGDAYLAVCGLPSADTEHAEKVVKAAQEIKDYMLKRHTELGDKTFEIRIGVHSGEVVAGIVGVKKFAYDIWGDTVNTAARMEQNSEAGKINISQTTYQLVQDKFNCTYRGALEAKNKGKLKMYFVD